jgi:hypothetical protein
LKLLYDKLVSNFTFKFNLRRYSKVCYNKESDPWAVKRSHNFITQCAYLVGRCRLNR